MRADKFFAERYGSRTKASEAIAKGLIIVNGKTVSASTDIKPEDKIEILNAEESFVSLGGYKLSKALKEFNVCVESKIFADIGASTGGFTDCLFQNGAKKVYCIDVGNSQLHTSLKEKNVVVIDNFNARNLHCGLFKEQLDGVVIDVSFISLTYILREVSQILGSGKSVFALLKPQFECGERALSKNGIVKDAKYHRLAIEKIYNFALECKLAPVAITCAPLNKGKNIEYIYWFIKDGQPENTNNIIKCVKL